jgi:hypothetical protein
VKNLEKFDAFVNPSTTPADTSYPELGSSAKAYTSINADEQT